jgi:hypothetical protein
MKKAILSLVGVLLLLSCEQQNKAGEKVAGLGKPTGEEIHFTVTELSEEDFDVVERNDTTYYLKQLREGLEGKDIQFDQSLVSDLSAKVRFGFGFLQYTTDDNPASALEYTKQSKWSDLQIKEGVIEIPNFNGNSNNRKVYEALGFKDRKQLLDWIAGEELEGIKNESIQAQTNFYQALLKKKSQYVSCCPEYIRQANAFLSSQSKNKKSIDELGLELTYKSLTIDISGQLKNGEKFHRVIVEK